MRPIKEIVLHTTYTPEGREHDVEDIRAWHKAKGWSDIGYHYLIKIDGTIEAGRPLDKIGAHAKGHNQGSIGICYVGGMSADHRSPLDTRTSNQKQAMQQLVSAMNVVFGGVKVLGHNEISSKSCPCFDVGVEFSAYR